jgi:hypothetical protein
MKHSPHIFLTMLLFFTLVACVPTASRVYNGPEVTGTVLRLSDLTPIAGATISYGDLDSASSEAASTNSNEQGDFTLTPTTTLNIELRMPAHMIKRVSVHTRYSTYGQSADVVRSQNMNREYEQYDVGIIILDDNPNKLAKPLIDNGVDLRLLNNALLPNNLLQQCNHDDARGAINKLNITRKLARKITQLEKSTTQWKLASKSFQNMKQQTMEIWEYLQSHCKTEPKIELSRLKWRVLKELENL